MTDDLVKRLRDEDSYYRVQEKHWCIDAEELERQRLEAADRIEALEAEVARLREALKFYADPKHHAYVKAAGCNCIEADGGDTARAALGDTQ